MERTDACICHGAGDEEHRPVSGRDKRQASLLVIGTLYVQRWALGRTLAAAVDRDD